MAAIIFAVRKKDAEKRKRALERSGSIGGGKHPSEVLGGSQHGAEEEEMPEWAEKWKNCECWQKFWGNTNMDERFWQYQPQASAFYNGRRVQVIVACLIFGNFISNVVEKEIDPAGDVHAGTFEIFEYFFNIAFTIAGTNLVRPMGSMSESSTKSLA